MEDKYQAQVYAKSLGIPTIPLLAVLRHSREFSWDVACVLRDKTNHWSGKVWIDVDGVDITAGGSSEDHKFRDFDSGVTSREMDEIMPKTWSGMEWAAGNIADKRILIQPCVPQALDIKVYAFPGQAAYYYTYGYFDPILDHASCVSQLHAIPHTPCGVRTAYCVLRARTVTAPPSSPRT